MTEQLDQVQPSAPTPPTGDQMTAAAALVAEQEARFEAAFEHGSRNLVTSQDPLVRYLTRWRMETAWRRLVELAPDLGRQPSVLFLCAGDAGEATVLADLGVRDITISDLSEAGVNAALTADPRLKGIVANAIDTGIATDTYDVVVVQDGLHHLPEPVKGFTEQLRIARRAAFFLEGANSLAGRRFGLEWEVEGEFVNHVFRWDRRMVDQVAKSYLGRNSFTNASFSFWHHNTKLASLGARLGGGDQAVAKIAQLKRIADRMLPEGGNQFCGMIVKLQATE